ncbi:MAG: hypothetical protein HFF98_08665 [Oscillibacter sp.]|jgi:hypothetical protein|nr:hypothetical protein [Oscillibacter sp.]
MDKKLAGKRILIVLLLVLLGVEVRMELRYSCDELSVTSTDTEKILRRAPEVVITEEDKALMTELLAVPSVQALVESGENGDVHAWEEPGAAEAAGKYLDAESAESLTVSALFDEGGSVVFAGWREEEGVFYLQEGPEEGAYYKLYSPKRGRIYENWDNERAQRSEVHRRWFAWLRDGLWKDEG